MAYIGRTPAAGRYEKLDDISGSFNGVLTQFNLTQNGSTATVFNAEQLMVSIGGVIQEPVTDYTITNNNQINFTSAPLATDTFFAVLLGDTLTGFTVPDRSITNSAFATSTDFTGRTFTNLTLTNPSLALANATSTFTVDPGVANTNIYSDHLNITANSVFTGTVDFTGATLSGVGESWSIVNSNTTLTASQNVFANTRNSLTLTLPASATLGDAIRIVDNEGLASSNNITISRNGHNIQGQSANLSITTARAGISLVYESSRNGWVLRENF